MTSWNEAVEEAKEELGVRGYTDNWDEVIFLAKEIYWRGENFKDLKQDTIIEAENKCVLCNSTERLTAHHIYYKSDTTICLCKECHEIVHSLDRFGFVQQQLLEFIKKDNSILTSPIIFSYLNSIEGDYLTTLKRELEKARIKKWKDKT